MNIAEQIKAAAAASTEGYKFGPDELDVGRRLQTIRPDEQGVASITIHEMISDFDGYYGVLVGNEIMSVTPAWRDAQETAVRLYHS